MSDTAAPIATVTLHIADLRPTQMSVGLIEVRQKRDEISAIRHDPTALAAFLIKNAVPGVYGPHGRFYIIDHHHMARAMFDEGIKSTKCNVLQDLSKIYDDDEAAFWTKMSAEHWAYPYDHDGHGPKPFSAMPTCVEDLKNDVYRSLAGAVERGGGFVKTSVPFEEFVWADRLRSIVPLSVVESDFAKAVKLGCASCARVK